MGTKSWEWEGMGTRKSFPHISNEHYTSGERHSSLRVSADTDFDSDDTCDVGVAVCSG